MELLDKHKKIKESIKSAKIKISRLSKQLLEPGVDWEILTLKLQNLRQSVKSFEDSLSKIKIRIENNNKEATR